MNNLKISKDNILKMVEQGNFIAEKATDGTVLLIQKNESIIVDESLIPVFLKPKLILKQMLHTEMRIARKNITEWISEIEKYFLINPISDIEKFAIAMNQFGLILVYANLKTEAVEFCKKLIFFYHSMAKQGVSEFYLIQPFINLIRLYRLQHDYVSMEKSLSIFSGFQDETELDRIVFQTIININEADKQQQKYLSLIRNIKFVEVIKAAIAQQNFNWIIQNFSPEIQSLIQTGRKIYDLNTSYKAEALVIAYHHLGLLREAYKIASFFFQNGVIAEIQVFSYRMTELYLSLGLTTAFHQEMSKLSKYIERCLLKEVPILSEVLFAFGILNLIENNFQKKLFLEQMIQCFKKLNEEIGVIECLNKLILELKVLDYQAEYLAYLDKTGFVFFRADNKLPTHIERKIYHLLTLFENQYSRFFI